MKSRTLHRISLSSGHHALSSKFLRYLLVILFAYACVDAQRLPTKIRGYSVYRADIIVSQKNAPAGARSSDTVIYLGEPVLKEISVTGLTLKVPVEFTAMRQSGRVDFLAFPDLQVNGMSVEVDEYRDSFAFKKGELVKLPSPAKIFIPTTQLLRAATSELNRSQKEWTVTGRVLIFGKFRKFGFEHKRVVPIDIDFKIANPLQNAAPWQS
jgi:hypothetical protein